MKKQISFAALLFIILFTACKKDKTPELIPATNVYVTGHQWDSVSGYDKSGIWKNGAFAVNTLNSNRSHYGYAIALSGNDVYTTGYENTSTMWKCHVWKNGMYQYSLGDGYSLGSGIAVMGGDVYVAGYAYEPSPVNRSAMLWKNNSTVNVLASNVNTADASAITTSGTDIYVSGREANAGKLWKNGTALTLNNAAGCTITSIAVDGTDVYAAGYTDVPLRVRYWKNGNAVDVTTPGSAFGNAIAVANGDVYIAGIDLSGPKAIATYWKNGVAVTLGDGIKNSRANGIAIKGTDVYVAGEVQGANNLSDYATVWKNGQATTIGFQNSRAKAIVVK
jgi:hypothetical protein